MALSHDVPLRTRVEWAAGAARARIPSPMLFSVVVECGPADDAGGPVQCGFQHERRTWFGRRVLDVCQVRVADSGQSAAVTSYGTYRAEQYRRMAAIKEFPFPFRPLDLSELAIEPAEARARLLELARPGAPVEPLCLGLALTSHGGRLAWQSTVDVPGVGMHSVGLDAATGQILFHKFDRYHPSPPGN